MNRSSSLPVILIILGLILAACLCICCLAALAFITITNSSTSTGSNPFPLEQVAPISTPVVIRPTRPASSPLPQASSQAQSTGTPPATAIPALDPQGNLERLHLVEVPIQDPYDLARRLEGKGDVPATLDPPASYRQVGEQDSFWVSDSDTNDFFQAPATLRMVTDHAYFWIADDVSFHQADLEALAEAFENQIYPTDRAFFGSEWTPGVDGDPHVYILYTTGLGGSVAGYFSATDSLNPAINQYSNAHDMFVFNADLVALDDEYTYGVLAHELQHMILWNQDRNEIDLDERGIF